MVRLAPLRGAGVRRHRVLLAVLVLLARLVGPGVPAALALELPPGAFVICHAGNGDASPAHEPAKNGDHEHACQLCPACHLAVPPALLGSDTFLPLPSPLPRVGASLMPRATGPPRLVALATPATGPPPSVV